jgi:hypothetical protein
VTTTARGEEAQVDFREGPKGMTGNCRRGPSGSPDTPFNTAFPPGSSHPRERSA